MDIREFFTNVDVRGADECWPWKLACRDGYGLAYVDGRLIGAHRVAFAIANSIDISTLTRADNVRHSCDNKPCCNPSHLLNGTHLDNMRDVRERGNAKGKHLGESHGRAVLTANQVREIREKWESGRYRKSELITEFGITQSPLNAIIEYRTWRHVLRRIRR